MTIEYTQTEDAKAADVWRTTDEPCQQCCGPWLGFVRRKWRQIELGTTPALTLGGVDPPINSVMELYLDGCYEVCIPPDYPTLCTPMTTESDREDCLATFADVVTAVEADVDDAEAFAASALAAAVTAQADLATAESDAATAQGSMEVERTDISSEQMELMGIKIREQTYITLGDTAAAAATALLITAKEEEIAEHPYWDALAAYNVAVFAVGGAQDELYSRLRSLDEANRKLAIEEFRLDCAQSNETDAEGSTAPDVQMKRLTLADVGFFLNNGNEICMLSSGTEREGWYILGQDMSQLAGTTPNTLPLPQDTVSLNFQWREQFRPATGTDPYTYGADMDETVGVPADTLYGLSSEYHVDAPTDLGKTYVVSPPQRATVEFIKEVHGGSLEKVGFMAYKTTAVGVSKIFGTETASGESGSGDAYSGSQEMDGFDVIDTFSENVPADAKSAVWPPDVQSNAVPSTQTETTREFSNGLAMALSDEVLTSEIESPVDSYYGDAWGTALPEGMDPARFEHAHHILQGNDTSYSRAKARFKISAAIPVALPYDITLECTWVVATLVWSTGEWVVDTDTRDVVMPAGETEITEADWTEVEASEGEMVVLRNLDTEPHPDVFFNAPVVVIAPPA